MKSKVKQTIDKFQMIQNKDSITVALSGGADSVCLLLVLLELKKEFDISLQAVHINHKIRSGEATRDALFCKDLCKTLGVPFEVFEIDVPKEAKEQSLSIEEAARKVRYQKLKQVARGGKIATAHTLDDVAETLILNVTRSSSINGLCSIPPVRENIIRPIIECTREQVEEYLKSKNQEFVTDSTNLDDEYSRNKIRHHVVPVLREINPAFLTAVKRLTENANATKVFIEKQVSDFDTLTVDKLREKDEVLLCEYVSAKAKREIGLSLDNFHIKKCVEVIKNNSKCQLPLDNFCYIENNKLKFSKIETETQKEYCVKVEEKTITPYNTYYFRVVDLDEYKNKQNVHNLLLNNAIDYDKICHSMFLRSRKPGDRIVQKGRRVNKKVKAIFTEKKIGLYERVRLAVLESNGEIVWVENIGVADAFSPNKDTKKVIIINREVDYHK